MGLKNMSLKAGSSIGASGGTDQVFAETGITIQNGLQLMVPADTDYQTRRTCTIKYRPPTLDPKTGRFSKDKKTMVYTVPFVLTDGSISFQVVRVEREVHPTYSAANAAELCVIGAQLFGDVDVAAFWATGSMA